MLDIVWFTTKLQVIQDIFDTLKFELDIRHKIFSNIQKKTLIFFIHHNVDFVMYLSHHYLTMEINTEMLR